MGKVDWKRLIVHRDYDRTEDDDFKLTVVPVIETSSTYGAVKLYDDAGNVVGWKVKPIYE